MASRKQAISDNSASHTSARKGVEHAIQLMTQALAKPRYVIHRRGTKGYLEMLRDIPYCIHATEIKGTQILVNRNYKPLGNKAQTADVLVSYEDAKNMHVSFTEEQIACLVSPDTERHLFRDGDAPWCGRREATACLERLRKLIELL